MKETEVHVVKLPEVTRDEAESAFWRIMLQIVNHEISLEESNELWQAYRDFFIFVLAENGELPDDPPHDIESTRR